MDSRVSDFADPLVLEPQKAAQGPLVAKIPLSGIIPRLAQRNRTAAARIRNMPFACGALALVDWRFL